MSLKGIRSGGIPRQAYALLGMTEGHFFLASLREGGGTAQPWRKESLKIVDLNNSNSFRLLRIRSAASSLNEGVFFLPGDSSAPLRSAFGMTEAKGFLVAIPQKGAALLREKSRARAETLRGRGFFRTPHFAAYVFYNSGKTCLSFS